MIDIGRRVAHPVGQATATVCRIVVCTTGRRHLLDDLPVPADCFEHHATRAHPALLGFECHAVLRDALGRYDHYCYLEDDLVLRDPWFFRKLAWANALVGADAVVQPHRYEVAARGPVRKVYIDGDLAERVTAPHQDVTERPLVRATVMGAPLELRRALNPHSGCWFLDAARLSHWTTQPHFLDRDTSFVGPLESAATLGLMRTFKVYKPAPATAAFLEIEHCGTAFLRLVRPPAAGAT